MDESDVRLQIDHALQWYGYWPEHNQDARKYPTMCPHCGGFHSVTVTPERKGYADLRAEHPYAKPISHIEVKVVGKDKKSFRFDQIEPEQRNRMNKWTEKGGKGYLAIGKIVPMGSKSRIQDICVLPWTWYLENIEAGREKSIAWNWELYEKKPRDFIQRGSISSLVPFFYWLLGPRGADCQFSNMHPLVKGIKFEEVPYFKQPKGGVNAVSQPEQVTTTD